MSLSESIGTHLFEDQVVAITGGAGGLGRVIGETLAALGADLVLLDREGSGVVEVAQEIGLQFPDRSCTGLTVDITEPSSVETVFSHDALAEIDLLINSAGIREIAPAEELSPEEWTRVVDVNLNGTFFSIRYALNALKRRKGAILNIASVAGLIAMENRPAYSATKHAIVGLTKNLAHDLGKYSIRVNAIAPGTVKTPMTEAYYSDAEFLKAMETVVPLKQEGRADDIARAVVFLGSELARFVSGTVLPVDGGWLAQKNYVPGGTSMAYQSPSS